MAAASVAVVSDDGDEEDIDQPVTCDSAGNLLCIM